MVQTTEENEKVAYAKVFIDKLANGINPLDDSVIASDDIINNVHISRCLFYVSEVLQRVYENGGVQTHVKVTKKAGKAPFEISEEELKNFQFSDRPISLSELVRQVNALIDVESMKKLRRADVQKWLIANDFLMIFIDQTGRHTTRPTNKGKQEGISLEWRQRMFGVGQYEAVLYNRKMQEFITSHANEIDEMYAVNKSSGWDKDNKTTQPDKRENQGQPWDKEQEQALVEMYRDGLTIASIAKTMGRAEGGIRSRLSRLGLLDN
jgi:hypothetical protein